MEILEMDAAGTDDGRIRTGTVWTATAHAFTAIVGSGILALPWSVAQLGWILGPFFLVFYAVVTYSIAILLCDCYRTPDPVYFPLTMYMVQANIKRGGSTWIIFQVISLLCLIVTLVSAIGSMADILEHLKHAKLFHINF